MVKLLKPSVARSSVLNIGVSKSNMSCEVTLAPISETSFVFSFILRVISQITCTWQTYKEIDITWHIM